MRGPGRVAVIAAVVLALAAGASERAAAAPGPPASASGAPAAARGDGSGERAELLLHMLDYVAVDYPAFVKDGQVVDQAEYDEQVEFVTQARALLDVLPARPERGALVERADRLAALVKDRAPGAQVAAVAGELRWAVIRAYGVTVAPRRPPDLGQAPALYAARCAACHGATGHGDGPAGRGLEPAPSSFHDRERMAQRSVHGLYGTITLGVEGTGMTGFGDLGDEQRWALAFHVATLGQPEDEVQRGAALWRAGRGRDAFADLAAVTTRSAREVEAGHGGDGVAVLAYLRAHPDALAAGTGGAAIGTTRRLLRASLEAYREGRTREAHDLAVSSYLDGFEPIEASLDAVDRRLRGEIEAAMMRYRGLLRDGAPVSSAEAEAAAIEGLLGRARDLLDGGSLPSSAVLVSAFVILVREGLEALLVVAAMVALLVRADRRDALPWVHGGWLAALALGGLTWVVASHVIAISGATRELTEGVTALLAAAILLYVGFWMHGKSYTRRWQDYLARRLGGALGRRTMSALALVSFLAVYREAFETVLFYQALAVQAGPAGRAPLLGGLLAGAGALAVLSWVIVKGSARVPLRAFFAASAALVGLLAVVLAGKGINALQEAGAVAIRSVSVPSLPWLGVYPSLQGLAVQAALIVVILGGFACTHRAATRAP